MTTDTIKRHRGQPAPDCPHCKTPLTGFYELGGTRAICPKCGRQGPSKSDFEAAARGYLKKHGGGDGT